jgi:hypothetical protein
MILDTTRGPVLAALLEKRETTREIPAGQLTTVEYLLDGEVVKCDQTVKVSEAAMEGFGSAQI